MVRGKIRTHALFSNNLQFLQDIFDALFAILNESAEQYGTLVFRALVSTMDSIVSCNSKVATCSL